MIHGCSSVQTKNAGLHGYLHSRSTGSPRTILQVNPTWLLTISDKHVIVSPLVAGVPCDQNNKFTTPAFSFKNTWCPTMNTEVLCWTCCTESGWNMCEPHCVSVGRKLSVHEVHDEISRNKTHVGSDQIFYERDARKHRLVQNVLPMSALVVPLRLSFAWTFAGSGPATRSSPELLRGFFFTSTSSFE